ncbi:MAG: tRNA (N(6)-L-threonylcarbamoyladenosine(37)-C(2))-methylthiotransferase MtaB [Candidatus Kapaibacterium sp.]
MKIAFYNIGCKVNYAEISALKDSFTALGHEVVEPEAGAGAFFINTCSVTSRAEADCRKAIRRIKRENPGAWIGVLGCFAQLRPKEIASIDGVDAVFGMDEKNDIPELAGEMKKSGKPLIMVSDNSDARFYPACACDSESRTRAILKIQDGCDYHCSYCTVPKARGGNRGIEFESIPAQIEAVAEAGYKEAVLTGINLGEYRSPTGEKLIDALRLIDKIDTGIRIRISSIEPHLLTDEIIDMAAGDSAVCPHFHVPLQSGSDEILKKMRRRYLSSDFRDLILKIKRKSPHCGIGVDVISGFPGEDDKHFRETYNLLESLPVSYLHAFSYSVRPGTPAAGMKGKVRGDIIKERTAALNELSERKRHQFYEDNLGRKFTLLSEGLIEGNYRLGWTENYIRCGINASIEENELLKIVIKQPYGKYCLAETV